ncbi:MAG TPA: hypothetical protein VFS52_07280 [Steroidobacteraceae bacterium]|nr:hypothetical protein [Steroidobacteraceae bacterium]
MSAILETPIAQHAYRREVFSVDGVRVILDARGNWSCESRTCTQGSVCAHVVQARRFKEMRGKKRAGTVIEIELTAAELRALTQSAVSPANDAVAAPKRKLGNSAWPLVLTLAAIAAVLGAVTYVANRHTETVASSPAYGVSAAMADPAASAPPVEFANPFDRKEVFEFPPGTSELEAHDSVEQQLLQRARHRLTQPAEPL